MPDPFKKLDNPAWHALTESHAGFAEGTAELKRYDPSIVLFSGYHPAAKDVTAQFDEVYQPGDSFFLFDEFPALPVNYQVETIVPCMQMVCQRPVSVPVTETIVKLEKQHWNEMYQLVSTVFPGYYLPGTPVMGDYFGIFKEAKLVAIAGERLTMYGLTEISAVVTHPHHQGRRYAQQLMTVLHEKNLQCGSIPFLHTGHKNERAIGIYEMLGYTRRRIINATKIKRLA
jgi:GNAT superfamily N-acetyltransferase